MITLRLQLASTGQFLVLKKDGTLTLELHTTLFNDQDDFFGSISYPGEMPLEPNRAVLKNAHIIGTSAGLRTVWVWMWLGMDMPWKLIKLNFTVTDQIIQYNLYIDTTLITSALSNTTLAQLYGSYQNLPAVPTSQVNLESPADIQAFMQSTLTAKPGAMPMVFFPYKNEGAYTQVAGDLSPVAFVGMWDAATNTPALHNDNGAGISPVGSLTGYFYKCSAYGTVDFNDDPDNPDEQTFTAEIPYAMFDGLSWWATANPYGYIIENSATTDIVYPLNPYINRWEMDYLGNGSFVIDPVGGPYCQTQSPFFFLAYVIRRVAAYFGFNTIVGRVMNEAYFNCIVIWSGVTMDKTGVIPDMTYFMPGVSCASFLKEVRSRFGLLIDFDLTTNTMIVESLLNLVNLPVNNDLRRAQIKSFREVPAVPTYYSITEPIDPNDGTFAQGQNIAPMVVGDEVTAVTETTVAVASVATNMITETAQVNPLYTNLDQDTVLGIPQPPDANWRIPHIKQSLYAVAPYTPICAVSADEANNFKLRFLYWAGMQQNSAGYVYPYGSSDNLSVAGGTLTSFNMSFAAAATDYNPIRFYYQFILASKPFEQGYLLNKYQLASLKANMTVLVRDFNQACIPCIMDQTVADLQPSQELIPVKITLYPVILPDNAVQPVITTYSAPPTPPVDNGLVYVRFAEINLTETYETEPSEATNVNVDLYVTFWADSAGTVPKSVTGLPVMIRVVETIDYGNDGDGGTTTETSTLTYSCDGESETVYPQAPKSQVYTDGSGNSETWVYTLLSSAYYTIIS